MDIIIIRQSGAEINGRGEELRISAFRRATAGIKIYKITDTGYCIAHALLI